MILCLPEITGFKIAKKKKEGHVPVFPPDFLFFRTNC